MRSVIISLIFILFSCENQQYIYIENHNDTSSIIEQEESQDIQVNDIRQDNPLIQNDIFALIQPKYEEIICGNYNIVIKFLKEKINIKEVRIYINDQLIPNKYQIIRDLLTINISLSNLETNQYNLRIEILNDSDLNPSVLLSKIIIDNYKCDNYPNVFFVEPENNSYVKNNFSVKVKALDDFGVVSVSFYIDNNLLFYDTAAPFETNIDISVFEYGIHRIKAFVVDTAGKRNSDEIELFFDNIPPVIKLLSPAENNKIYTNSINVLADIIDDGGIKETNISISDTISNVIIYNKSMPQTNKIDFDIDLSNVDDGLYSLILESKDLAGNESYVKKNFVVLKTGKIDILSCDSQYENCVDISSKPLRGILYMKVDIPIQFNEYKIDIFLYSQLIGNDNIMSVDIKNFYDGIYDLKIKIYSKDINLLFIKQIYIQSCDIDRDGFYDEAIECGGNDCDDRRHSINPAIPDFAGDNIDSNCDGSDGTDLDRDGYNAIISGGDDCNDFDKDINPSADDKFGDGIDSNCDGMDGIDNDRDGYAKNGLGNLKDCNDEDPDINPSMIDYIGDGIDNNCDGIDGKDFDKDGFASIESGGTDCDDSDYSKNPMRYDYYGDELDTNCDGVDGIDNDRDGYLRNYPTSNLMDCDDNNPDINPGIFDKYGDDIDSNCDGVDGIDKDRDGYASILSNGTDCDDNNYNINPKKWDDSQDGVDNNCDGVDGTDYDSDGFASIESGGNDCDDFNKDINPFAMDLKGDNIDNNCDGVDGTDYDRDGFASIESGGTDCDDNNPNIYQADCYNKCEGTYVGCGTICSEGCISGYQCNNNYCIDSICPKNSKLQVGAIYPSIGYCSTLGSVSPNKGPARAKYIKVVSSQNYTLTSKSINYLAPAIDNEGNIYIPYLTYYGDGGLMILNPDTSLKSKISNIRPSYSTPSIGEDGTIYLTTYNDTLYSISKNGDINWKFQTRDYIYTSPIIGPSGAIYISSTDRSLYKISNDGKYQWEFITGNSIYKQHIIDEEENIYLIGNDISIYKIGKDGNLIYRYIASSNTIKPAIDEESNFYFIDKDSYLVSLDKYGNMNFKVYQSYIGNNWLIYFNKRLLIIGDKDIKLFDIKERKTLWSRSSYQIPSATNMPVLDSSGKVYIPRGCAIEILDFNTGENIIYLFLQSDNCNESAYVPVIHPNNKIYIFTDRAKLLIIGEKM